MRSRIIMFAALLTGLAVSTAAGQDRSSSPSSALDQAEMQKRIVKSVYDAASLGTDIFNKGNFEGCYRLYQGTLMAVQPLLQDQRPKLAQSVKDSLERAKSLNPAEGAHELRKALDEIQNEIAPTAKPDVRPEPRSDKSEAKKKLWDRLGGAPGVQTLVQNCVLTAMEDDKLRRVFTVKKLDEKTTKDLIQNSTEYISSVSGGPLTFSGKDVKAAFAGLKITDAEFDEIVSIFEKQLAKKPDLIPGDAKDLVAALEALRKDVVEVKSKK